MQFHFTDEQEEFRSMIRRFLSDTSPTADVRRLMLTESGYDPQVWRRLAEELGLTGLAVPEQHGGAGFGPVEVGIAMEEMGRSLLCAPYLASAVLAVNTIGCVAGAVDQGRLLPGIAAGTTIATLAVTEPLGSPDLAAVTMTSEESARGHRLSGTKTFVLDGCSASLLLVVARLPGSQAAQGLSLFEVQPDAPGLVRRNLSTLDPTRKQALLQFQDTPARLVGELGNAGAALQKALDLTAIAFASEMAGGAQRLLEDTLEYAKLRMQFGRSIASFQAIKHRFAELLLNVELAKSAAYSAAQAAADDSPELPYLASLAKAGVADTYLQTAAEAIQLHGGIGFTADQDTQLWFKRAKASEVLFGDPTWHRERMIQALVALEGSQAEDLEKRA